MSKIPLVSAILPVYNVEDYLQKAIESLEDQTYSSIEIIIVNDGSTDSSLDVANQMKNTFDNVKVISQKNQGAPVARNRGIRESSGKYLYFMDPDDWIEEKYIKSLVDSAENNHSEMVIGGFTNVYFKGNQEIKLPIFSNEVNYEDAKTFRKDVAKYLNNTMLAVPWNKLYLASYVKENALEFPKIKWDDLHFNLEVIRNISRVSVSDNVGYHFLRNRPGSETTTVFNGKLFTNRKKQFLHVLEVFQSWDLPKSEMEQVYYYYSSRIVQVIQEIVTGKNISKYEKKSLIKNVLSDETVDEALIYENGGGLIMHLTIAILRTKNIYLIMILGKMINFSKKHLSSTFLKIRRNSMRV